VFSVILKLSFGLASGAQRGLRSPAWRRPSLARFCLQKRSVAFIFPEVQPITFYPAIRALLSYPRRIRSLKEAKAINGIGDKTAKKARLHRARLLHRFNVVIQIMEVIETGELKKIGYEMTDAVKTARLFRGIYGVGESSLGLFRLSGTRSVCFRHIDCLQVVSGRMSNT